ncbi:hypothetical protein HDU87_000918 [Geranomyces variabilis]|uniref:Uncharacterized protein n=1 Tax=Geranomyces variabilis TaxID=109894 RepID=A0AAD5TH77_9FUNG|nr:hypothetical protein HDU87_000918 [Geranomyces variabilis]
MLRSRMIVRIEMFILSFQTDVISLKSNRKGVARAAKQFLRQDDIQALLNHRVGTSTAVRAILIIGHGAQLLYLQKVHYQGKDMSHLDIGAVHLGRGDAVQGASLYPPFDVRGGKDVPTITEAQMASVYEDDSELCDLRSALASVEDDDEKVVIEKAIKARQKELRRATISEAFDAYHERWRMRIGWCLDSRTLEQFVSSDNRGLVRHRFQLCRLLKDVQERFIFRKPYAGRSWKKGL